MILLRTNRELQQTFEKLIQVMKVPVKWNGIFAVIDNYIILQGEVRSLFFHFDSRKVVTNIIDIPVKEEDVQAVEGNAYVCNSINMILYVFGKWGSISGVRVEKNFVQLNSLFRKIMAEMQIEPEYTKDHFRFYKHNIRITYEDVIQAALEAGEKPLEESGEEESQGLWHKLVWKRAQARFEHENTNWSERKKNRLGNNFYLVGHLCPVCKKKMYMVVYPMDKEFRIETEEGGVLLARAATCSHCNSFYTPRPKKILSEGDVYTMQFGDDRKAYEDYLELLGQKGERVSNCRFNEYADGHEPENETDVSLEEFCENLSERSDEEIRRVEELMEEGFYPDESIRRLERKIKEQGKKKQKQKKKSAQTKKDNGPDGKRISSEQKEKRQEQEESVKPETKTGGRKEKEVSKEHTDSPARETGGDGKATGGRPSDTESAPEKGRKKRGRGNGTASLNRPDSLSQEQEKLYEKYEAKAKVSDRFSERQLKQFHDELSRDTVLDSGKKKEILDQVDQKIVDKRVNRLTEKVGSCEGKPYAVIKRVYDEVEQEEIPSETKEPLLTKLKKWLLERGTMEVRQLILSMPERLNRDGYRKFAEKIQAYEGVDLSIYEEKLHKTREQAEKQELEEMVRRARKHSRRDYKELSDKLRDGDFLPELVLPYQEKVDEKIHQMDEDAIAEICPNPMMMTFEEGMEAYRQLQDGDFLPELKMDALELLTKRLSKLKTDECELLVAKLKSELTEGGISENEKHHFYPAKKVLLEQALPEETELIDYALASYAADRKPFEYPVLVVDATRKGSGKEGIILTPDHLYYSTMFTSYGMEIDTIDKVTASTGLLNRGLYVHQKNGTKTKVPYAVPAKELTGFAKVLTEFIHYLQEKPESRELNYLAKEKHETICCFRCGYVYHGAGTCPKCGYQNNG